ncbi:Kinesin [Operophtera brumata]|uniref:Kinesin n=1 Tax=Operophtera brumata TaxID=104452 RepID=A0A0L7L1F9_OPEBR|nr:Kinesin [Operophtera brumata]
MSTLKDAELCAPTVENVRVVVRVRPADRREAADGAGLCVCVDRASNTVAVTRRDVTPPEPPRVYAYDAVFDSDTSQHTEERRRRVKNIHVTCPPFVSTGASYRISLVEWWQKGVIPFYEQYSYSVIAAAEVLSIELPKQGLDDVIALDPALADLDLDLQTVQVYYLLLFYGETAEGNKNGLSADPALTEPQ